MRKLDQDARAVSGFSVTAGGTAMRKVDEHRERLLNDRVRPLAPQVRNETDAAGIVLVRRVVQSLRSVDYESHYTSCWACATRSMNLQFGPTKSIDSQGRAVSRSRRRLSRFNNQRSFI